MRAGHRRDRHLREILGAQLVAYVGRVDSRSVREWAEGSRAPGADVIQRLRTSYYVAGILVERESAKTIQAWFQGMNPQLGDQFPAALLPGEPLDGVGPKAIGAHRRGPHSWRRLNAQWSVKHSCPLAAEKACLPNNGTACWWSATNKASLKRSATSGADPDALHCWDTLPRTASTLKPARTCAIRNELEPHTPLLRERSGYRVMKITRFIAVRNPIDACKPVAFSVGSQTGAVLRGRRR